MSMRRFSDTSKKTNSQVFEGVSKRKKPVRASALLCAVLLVAIAAVYLALGRAVFSEPADSSGSADAAYIEAASADEAIAPSNLSTASTLAAGGGGGNIKNLSANTMEINENAQSAVITDRVENVIVSSPNCIVHIVKGAHVRNLVLLESAEWCRVVTDGTAGAIEVSCDGAQLIGTGSVGTVTLNRTEGILSVRYYNVVDNTDRGLNGASLNILAPSSSPTGKKLIATAALEGADPGKECTLIWYVNGEVFSESVITTGNTLPGISYTPIYDRFKPDTAVISAVIQYESRLGVQYELAGEASVKLENYSKEYWMKRDAPDVLKKVTTGYKGDYTLEWAEENDYSSYEKEVWVNAKEYSSDTKYLIWISIAHQRVNIFKGSKGNWELHHSCIVGTGAPGRGTMLGVCKTTYKQKTGWTTSDYTCKPVVRFREGTGYAFHSRLYYPNSDRIKDARIGYPISLGCIRMYDEDIQFIYDNIPNGTTVVIY